MITLAGAIDSAPAEACPLASLVKWPAAGRRHAARPPHFAASSLRIALTTMPLAMKKQARRRQCRRLTDKSQNVSVEPSPKLRISTDLDYDQCGAVIAAWVDAISPLLLIGEPPAREETVER